MKSRLFPFTIVLLVSAFLAGCGGGGGGAPATPPVNIGAIVTQPVASSGSTPSATAAPGTSSTNAPLSSKIAFNAHFVIMASADQVAQNAARKAAGANRNLLFVSPGTNGISLVISQGGTQISTQAADVSGTSPLCSTSGGSRTCNIPLNLPSGTYSFAATLYNETPSGGVIPGGAQELGTAVASSSILIGQTNSVDFFIGAVVASLGIGTASNTAAFGSLPASGVASSYTILLIPTDASGNAISGSTSTFANQPTVTLGENGGSGHMHLVYNGNASGTSATVVHASDSLQVAYDGAGSPGYYVTVSLAASGATTSTLQLSPLFVAGDSKYSGGTLTYTATAQSEAFAITEASAPGTVTYGTTSGAACPSLPTGSNPQLPVPVTGNVVGSGASATMTVTANVAPQAPTGCDVKIADNLGTSITIPIVLPSGTSAASSAVVNAQIDPTHYSTGTPAALNVTQGGTSVTSLTVHQSSPSTLTVAESNDVSAPVVTSTTCTGMVTVASSLSQGTWSPSAMGSLSGTIVLLAIAGGTCTLQVADGNGQSVSIALTALTSGSVTEFAASPLSSNAISITSDRVGNLWAIETNMKVGKITLAGALTEYGPVALSGTPTDIVYGPDGNLWIAETSGVAKVSTSGSLLNEYTGFANTMAGGITLGSDNNLWMSETINASRKIATGNQGSFFSTPTCSQAAAAKVTTAGAITEQAVGSCGFNSDSSFWSNTFATGAIAASGSSLFVANSQSGGWQDNAQGGYDVTDVVGASAFTISYSGIVVGWGYSGSQLASPRNMAVSGGYPWNIAQPCSGGYNVYSNCLSWGGWSAVGPVTLTLTGTAYSIASDGNGNVWIGLGTTIERINGSNYSTATYTTGVTSAKILTQGPDGNMWYVGGTKYGYVSP